MAEFGGEALPLGFGALVYRLPRTSFVVPAPPGGGTWPRRVSPREATGEGVGTWHGWWELTGKMCCFLLSCLGNEFTVCSFCTGFTRDFLLAC